jgi:hypothetical protein
LHELRPAPRPIQIFVAEDQSASRSSRALLRYPKGPRMAKVEISRGRRRYAPAVFRVLHQSPEV